MAITAALFLTEPQKVDMAVSKLGGRTREWALSCNSDRGRFSSGDSLNQQYTSMFAPSDQTFRVRSRLIATRQGKRALEDYVHKLSTPVAAMDPKPRARSYCSNHFYGGS